jgi:hypothetical protein
MSEYDTDDDLECVDGDVQDENKDVLVADARCNTTFRRRI